MDRPEGEVLKRRSLLPSFRLNFIWNEIKISFEVIQIDKKGTNLFEMIELQFGCKLSS